MHTPTLVHPANTQGNDSSGAPLAGQYNLPLLVTTFEAYFRAQIDAGKVRTSDLTDSASNRCLILEDLISLRAYILYHPSYGFFPAGQLSLPVRTKMITLILQLCAAYKGI
jgi:hypothetical protein